jgi:flagellar hook-basal body complex protein FliE
MIAPIGSAPDVAAVAPAGAASAAPEVRGPESFGDKLEQALARVDGTVHQSDDALAALASGREVDLHGAMIAMQEADIALRAMVTVRDRVVGAYEQLMNLGI